MTQPPPQQYDPEVVRAEVEPRYRDLHLISRDGKWLLRGTFPVEHEGQVLDRYQIELEIPPHVNEAPMVWELAGKIPRTRERHTESDGKVCWGVPEVWLLSRSSTRIVDFLDGPLRDFFLGQSVVARGGAWPLGEWPHHVEGLEAAYVEMLGLTDAALLEKYLDHVAMWKVNRRWRCFCGTLKRLRDCHWQELVALRERIPQYVAEAALRRLRSEREKHAAVPAAASGR